MIFGTGQWSLVDIMGGFDISLSSVSRGVLNLFYIRLQPGDGQYKLTGQGTDGHPR